MPKPMTEDNAKTVLKSTLSSSKDKKKAEKLLGKTRQKIAIYPEATGSVKTGDDALTAQEAKDLIGWTVQTKEDGETQCTNLKGEPVKCVNNANNRPFAQSWAETLAQEILRKRWRFNGETIIIGKYGAVLSGQHRLIALILAAEMWEKSKDDYPDWETEPVIETFLAVGIPEDDTTVNTIDTGKPRSLSDVVYRSDYFQDVSNVDRKHLARACDAAIRLFWDRTGVSDAYDIRRTHAEALDLLDRHRRLVECIKHVFQENVENKIGRVIGLGAAAALCYLMGTSKTKQENYYGKDVRDESNLDFSRMDDAQAFWVELVKDRSKLAAVREMLAQMQDSAGDAGVSFRERLALLIKAWNCGSKVTLASLKLEYHTDDEGIKSLAESPILGGIDKGDEDEVVLADEDEEERVEDTEEEEDEETPAPRGKKGNKLPKDGDEVWVKESKGEPWFGTLMATRKGPGGKTIASVRFQANQKKYDVDYNCLSFTKPD